MTASRSHPNFDDYRVMMEKTAAPAHLQSSVLTRASAIRNQEAAEAAVRRRAAFGPRAFTGKRSRSRIIALAACLILALGIGVAALGLVSTSADSAGTDGVYSGASDNFFQMKAFADEGGEPADGPVALSSQDFFLARSSVGPRYDADTDSYPGDVTASRSYNLSLTCSGTNVTSMTYRLESADASFYNWQLTDAARDPSPAIGSAMADVNQSSSFTVDYDNQDMNSAEGVHHEILFDYTLDDKMMPAWDELHAVDSQMPYTVGQLSDAELAPLNDASNKLEVALAKHDIDILSQAKLVLTATYADGTTSSKTYRFVPIQDFEQIYSSYLAQRVSSSGSTQPKDPQLYMLEELD